MLLTWAPDVDVVQRSCRTAERQRHNDIQELGWEIVRFTWADLHDPGEVRRRIVEAANRARARAPRPS